MADHASLVERLYLETPTPEFRLGLDLAADALIQSAGPALAVLSSPFYAVELLRRLPDTLHLAGSGSFDPVTWLPALQPWAWGELVPTDLESERAYKAILWAEPEADSAAGVASALHSMAAQDCRLEVIASTSLRRYLPAWQSDSPPARQPLNAAQIPALLRGAGWRVEASQGFHGLRSMTWTYLMRLANVTSRPDLADRCLFGLRRTYKEIGTLWQVSPLTLTTACRA